MYLVGIVWFVCASGNPKLELVLNLGELLEVTDTRIR